MGKKKLEAVIKAIQEAKEITPKGQLVKVYISNVLKHNQLRFQELKDVLQLLEDDEKILTLMRFPRYLLEFDFDSYDYTDMSTGDKLDPLKEYFAVKFRRRFNKWCDDYWANSKMSTKSLLLAQEEKEAPEREIVYRITFTSAREILLNDRYQIATPDFDRENEQVFSYLYNHPNEKFTKKQLEEELRTRLIKSPHKIIENLGFTGALRKAFFSVSKNSIQFRNPVKSEDITSALVAELDSLIGKA